MKKIFIILMFLSCIKVNASVVVMDADSNRILYEENMNERKLIASTSKIMTSIIALENAKLTDTYKVGNEIKESYGSLANIKENETLTLNDLLHGLMLQSGNDAALTISNNVFDNSTFIAKMNMKAFKLGMFNTSFENPHGLNETTKNYSTAYDMALLMRYAIKNKDFIKITSAKSYSVANHKWYNKNKLLSQYKYTISGKIGYTKSSGPVFVSAAKKGNKTLIIVSIDETDKFNLHQKLYEKYFDEYKKYTILNKYLISFKIKNSNNDYYYIKNNYYMLLKKDEIDKIKIKAYLNDNSSYIEVLLDNEKIHQEPLYKYSYNNRIKELKKLFKK